MLRCFVPVLFLLLATVLMPEMTAVHGGFSWSYVPLERVIPLNQRVELEALRARDRARHTRILVDVVDFSVQGTSDPYFVGLYFTKVKMGSPPREFNVQIDTGSDILWVNGETCSNCPQSSGLGIELNYFDTASSSTAALLSCSDPICAYAVQTATTGCPSQDSQCRYTFQYGDGSGTSGYYVSDLMYFETVVGHSMLSNSSATIIFGCSTYQSGDLTKTEKAVDGIFGFGRGALSVISQLSSRGITPKVFSHCLKGEGNGGGILVLGEILEPNIVYSPLVPSQVHYNLNLESVAVNGQLLSIDPAVFATADNQGTIVDTGTTLTYLVQDAYDPFVNAITTAVSQFSKPIISKGNQCYLVATSLGDIFPSVSLNFMGGASMVLKPEQYLMHYGFLDSAAMWCIGFQKVQQGFTILGDLVLKDRIVVYDLANQQIGWADYDCSSSVNVSLVTSKSKDEYTDPGQLSISCSKIGILAKLLPVTIVAFLVHIIVFMESQFL
ncbi:PREDICTED: aspartic proteinase-like protein 2 [Lupinus angustifolius]|uniref:aspartic proteinase-like protein 2 n=2 Tax=Lupinus angustifolius TaxID=3871 RepID=UPI00092FB7EF|nr:PREDICTED: aspartic proteinase-like protein 2 [Lupinus angustifolius]